MRVWFRRLALLIAEGAASLGIAAQAGHATVLADAPHHGHWSARDADRR